jgi:hypothetical protein
MAEKNEQIVDDLIKDLETTNCKSEISEPEHDENVEFQDALGPSGENSPYISSDESDCDDATKSENDTQLSKEEIEVNFQVEEVIIASSMTKFWFVTG